MSRCAWQPVGHIDVHKMHDVHGIELPNFALVDSDSIPLVIVLPEELMCLIIIL